jgi:hypothetical protein
MSIGFAGSLANLAKKYIALSAGKPRELEEMLLFAANLADHDTYVANAKRYPDTDWRSCTCKVHDGPYHVSSCPRNDFWNKQITR